MDISRATPPPAIEIHESQQESAEGTSHPRAFAFRSAASQSSSSSMAIPNASVNEAPPPLPPPKHIEDFDHGLDPGWTWGNRRDGFEFRKVTLAPIRHGSSLQGGYLHGIEGPRRPEIKTEGETDMDLDQSDRRGSSVSTLRSFSDLAQSGSLGDSFRDRALPSSFNASHQ